MDKDEKKACSLNAAEIKSLIGSHAMAIASAVGQEQDFEEGVERINYLNKRLKAKAKGETSLEEAEQTETAPQEEQKTASWN